MGKDILTLKMDYHMISKNNDLNEACTIIEAQTKWLLLFRWDFQKRLYQLKVVCFDVKKITQIFMAMGWHQYCSKPLPNQMLT